MRLLYRVLFVIVLVGGTVAAWVLPGSGTDEAGPAPAHAGSAARRDAIAFHERRLREDPESARDMAQLGALLMEEGRMTGDERAYVQAESLARRSLDERIRRNGRSATLLAHALLAQHRFGEAVAVARDLVDSEPEEPAYRGLLAESLMEVGDYGEAIGLLGSIRAFREDLELAPRFARWAELTGQPGEARRILRVACGDAKNRRDLTPEQRAWFFVRLADLDLRYGHLRAAASAIDQGLAESPGDWRLVLARARLEAARGEWKRAVLSSEAVVSTVPDPTALALLSSAHAQLGNHEAAMSYASAIEAIVGGPGSLHRAWALALLDAGHDVEGIVARAATDTLVRRDVHGLDLLAWALYRAGRPEESLPLARRAVALGTIEPALRYRAGMIELSAGEPAIAARHLDVALRGRNALTPAQVAEVRAALARATGATERK